MGLNFLQPFQPKNQNKPLGGRYKIIRQLGAGGFGQTFLAEDLHLPNHPQCVVKQLKPQTTDAKSLETARRLFDIEAQVLYELGNHDQIPRLLAHFEDEREFYLAQELIEGELLSQELAVSHPWSEARVLALLEDILQVLAFVHQQQVIHRDIKPSNLIRRREDGKMVLIDFGAVKQVSTQVVNPKNGQTKTISIGTQGYTPKEQLGGNPRFSSDIYALGIVAIQALTGIHPKHLHEDAETGEIDWRDSAKQVSPELAAILDRMVRYDFRVRYSTAVEALEALQSLRKTVSEPQPDYTSETTAVAPEVPSLATEATGSEMGQTSTNIWKPTEPSVNGELVESVQPLPSSSNLGSAEPLATPYSSTSSRNSTSAITSSEPRQKRFLIPLSVLAALGTVGAIALFAKSALSPPVIEQTASSSRNSIESPSTSSRNSIESPSTSRNSIENPSINAIKKLAPPSPASSPAASPTISANKPTSPTPASLPTESARTTAVKPIPPSPVTPAITQELPPQAPPVAKPAPPPAQPAAPAAPSRPEPEVSEILSQADRLREAGQYQKAVDLYNQVIARKPSAEAYWGRCYSLNSLQQPAEAIAACNEALALNPNYPEALWSKGNALDQQQRPAESVKLYEQATALKPDFAEAWNNQGVALLSLGRASEALTAFEQATTLKPNFASAWANRGAALWQLGRFQNAIASMDKALQIEPNNKDAINLRQLAREKLGR